MLERITQAITTHQLLTPGDRVVVAVSGGADSVALLHLFTRLQPAWKLALVVGHVDHGLRASSSEDAEFVRRLAARWRLPVAIERREVGRACADNGWSLEDGARRIRYDALQQMARRAQANRIALAHTADDQAETVLMRLLRGSGLLGLSAIPWQRTLDERATIIRPLLDVWREDVLAYLEAEGLSHCEDPSNRDLRFLRNRIRHELLPLLQQTYNPKIKHALLQLANHTHWEYRYLQTAAARQWKRVAKRHRSGAIRISVEGFNRQPKALQRQLLRQTVEALRGAVGRLEFRHWAEAERLFTERPNGAIVDLPNGLQLIRERDHVIAICARSGYTELVRRFSHDGEKEP
ncbi:MAG: tRNA lysidine(34) synthetase TilS [Candidatus Omnitrophica bacterium]|nr:tRNA lysidine(34) synthetase TilS [Candidatus Omnitrophota bacterium]